MVWYASGCLSAVGAQSVTVTPKTSHPSYEDTPSDDCCRIQAEAVQYLNYSRQICASIILHLRVLASVRLALFSSNVPALLLVHLSIIVQC